PDRFVAHRRRDDRGDQLHDQQEFDDGECPERQVAGLATRESERETQQPGENGDRDLRRREPDDHAAPPPAASAVGSAGKFTALFATPSVIRTRPTSWRSGATAA